MAREDFELQVLQGEQEHCEKASAEFSPQLDSYDLIVLLFSGGKDSLAMLLHLLELGVDPNRIHCHHHLVDGREGSTLLDYPVTEDYCVKVCRALGVELSVSWREGGIEREMLRNGTPTAPSCIPGPNGSVVRIGGNGPAGTRRKFPQQSASLSCRWCSASAKIDLFDRWVCNDPRFVGARTLVLTGERAEESPARAKYKVLEPHRADRRSSAKLRRHVDVWRAVHGWSEKRVWAIIKRWRLVPHVAYWLGFGRASCLGCVFSSKNQWATVRMIARGKFEQISAYEQEFGVTIHRKLSVVQQADAGRPYDVDPKWVAIANSTTFDHPVFMDNWELPPGAFGESAGPT
ncbi:phosphoadenosine phosphosulfate reductase [Ramlibacter sp. AN1133]|uniref:phosphoadenosine phosphosulfate reductase n=1 Tax=Ramlibacter sp. AN1133 TaxID=3133429 RepID=UPI0030C55EBB